jgi:GR25 family glycosyltransferase involved in LPS biosynthesis
MIYCINLPYRKDRRKRMEERFKAHDLDAIFVNAISKTSSIIEYYEHHDSDEGINLLSNNIVSKYNPKAQTACFASHLKALRTFLESDDEHGIICEDDVLLHNNFNILLQQIESNLPDDFNLCMLCWFPWDTSKYILNGKDPDQKNIYSMGIDNVLGAQMYLISKQYALECLKKYDRPDFGGIYDLKTSELIVRKSNGYLSVTPLSLEDCIDSDIRDESGMGYHIHTFSKWNYNDYNLGDDGQTPLNKYSIKNMNNIDNIITNMMNDKQYTEAIKLGSHALEYINSNTLKLNKKALSDFLDSYFVCAYYANDKNLALDIAKYYVNKIKDPEFDEVFQKDKDRIKLNFSFVSNNLFED